MVGCALTNRGVVRRDDGGYALVGFDGIKPEKEAALVALCTASTSPGGEVGSGTTDGLTWRGTSGV